MRCLFLIALLCQSASVASAQTDTASDNAKMVRVMSFNIRYGTASDGENHWDKRKRFLLETITSFSPDLLGTQETLKFQRDFLAEGLPGYGVVGVGRNDGRDDGEMTALYYRQVRFELVSSGHFWLSETPDTPGSRSWDSALPRMVTWVRLKDRTVPGQKPVLFLNTHFDHMGELARLESAKLLRRQLAVLGEGCAAIITGDFNAAADSDPYGALFGNAGDPALDPKLQDTWRILHPASSGDEGTFSGFEASRTNGARIDWIAASEDFRIRSAGIDRTSADGRTPSDHFPVTAELHYAETK